jgi:cysteine-rich repeat protein
MGDRTHRFARAPGAWLAFAAGLLIGPLSCKSQSDEHDASGARTARAGANSGGEAPIAGGTGGRALVAGRGGVAGAANPRGGAGGGAASGGDFAAGGRSSAGTVAVGGERDAGTGGGGGERCGDTGGESGASGERLRCGDGHVDPLEQCDDGNVQNNDGCGSSCRVEISFKCKGEPSLCTPVICGDGKREGNEVCDDGNVDEDDDCSPTCTLPSDCPAPGCTRVCGDGVASPGEECDDGNALDHDGCTPDCHAEPGYFCDEPPSDDDVSAPPCTPVCGDGLQTSEEACDDGTAANDGHYGGCGPGCTLGAHCGDGAIAVSINPETGAPFEECDDAVDDNCMHCKLVLPCAE